jgi:hypothetical protein
LWYKRCAYTPPGEAERITSSAHVKDSNDMPLLYIVARDRPDVFGYLSRSFMGDDGVKIVVDRRAVERRRRQESCVPDRRTGVDRRLSNIHHELSVLGWGLVNTTGNPPA